LTQAIKKEGNNNGENWKERGTREEDWKPLGLEAHLFEEPRGLFNGKKKKNSIVNLGWGNEGKTSGEQGSKKGAW